MVLVFVESSNGKFKKAALESLTYASRVAAARQTEVCALHLQGASDEELKSLAQYGAGRILQVNDPRLQTLDVQAYAKVVQEAAEKVQATCIIFSFSITAKAVAPYLAARLKWSYVPGAITLPETSGNNWIIRKNVFSGKAFADYVTHTPKQIIALLPNSISPEVNPKTAATEVFTPSLQDTDFRVKVTETTQASGQVTLVDAEVVVSGGRGLKGPENWGMVEEMAGLLGAATACSRPVSDVHWRPHTEHVGQTGLTIRPNLYIAIGISGAIQHLAGVNGSKVIVVINKDPEAPFFKAADYGIVGDAFEVVPKLNAAIRQFKAEH